MAPPARPPSIRPARERTSVAAAAIPAHALHAVYVPQQAYVDCFSCVVPRTVSHAQYVEAFYTTCLFRIERWLLRWMGKPSNDTQARWLAQGDADSFAAWTVEARSASQLLMCDFRGATRSWLMVEPVEGGTRLYFGSVVVARADALTGRRSLAPGFRALLGFHRVYSRALLAAARDRLRR